jgi:DNA-binding HxlR family transcriptional regulator
LENTTQAGTLHHVTTADDRYACSIARSLSVLGERWTLLVLREAFSGTTRFATFRERLGVAPDVLAERLRTLVEAGVLSRVDYQEAGSRPRQEYVLTPAGSELQVVLGALQQWGDDHLPHPRNPTVERRHRRSGRPLRVAFVDDRGRVATPADVEMRRTATYPAG